MRQPRVCAYVTAAVLWWAQGCVAAAPVDEVMLPRLVPAPTIDGNITAGEWQGAAVIDGFTIPVNSQQPEKKASVRIGFDDTGLYLGAIMQEPDPAGLTIRAQDGSSGVWEDDCLEVWVRTSDRRTDFDQFIVNAGGARQRVRSRASGTEQPRPTFRAAASVGRDAWQVELHIPLAEIQVGAPQPGGMVQLKLGREDPDGRTTVLSVWPPRAPYGGAEGYGRAYFLTNNLLPNADFSERAQGGAPAGWTVSEGQLERIAVVDDGGRRALRWQVPGSYCTISRSVQLEPYATYRIEGWVRGTAGICLRARTKERRTDETSRAFTVDTQPSDEYVYYSTTFATGEDPSALIIIGNAEGYGAGEVYLTGLAVVRENELTSAGPAIPVKPGETLWVTDVAVTDCRALRGFVGAPVDGRLDSVAWNGSTWEYGARNAGAGVFYDFNNGDGLHVTLADRRGIDAVQIRGGARVKLYRDASSYYQPGDGPLIWEFPSRAANSRALFPERVVTDRLSFFDLTDGYLSDLYFFRVGEQTELPEPLRLGLAEAITPPPPELAPYANRFEGEPGEFHLLDARGRLTPPLAENGWLHLVTEPMTETGLLAVGLRLNLPRAPVGLPLTVAVMDPFNPAQRVMSVELTVEGAGELHVILDHLDQVVPEGRRVWVAVGTGAATPLDAAEVELYLADRERARPEALEYRKWIVKTMFAALSEPRPWTALRSRDVDLDQWAKDAYAGDKVVEMMRELAFAKQLGPEDDIVRQYDEWIWRRAGLADFQPRIEQVPGAPEWAVVARQAWLEAREVVRWWLENRLVPTGEFGGRVGDDTDMYQNYAMFPVISDDPVAQLVVQGAAALAELAEATTLEAGLNKRSMDPLHAYEEGVNHEALMAWWRYGDPVYFERCLKASQSMPALTTVTHLGHRHFKSQVLGAEDLRINRPTDTDGGAHPLMLHPCFEVLWYNGHPQVERFLREWADGWLEHQQPGAYATAVEVATERPTEVQEGRPLYGGYASQTSAFVYMYLATGDRRYLRPFMDFYARGQTPGNSARSLPELLQEGALDQLAPEVLDMLEAREPYLPVLRRGDTGPLVEALKSDIAELQRFPHMYTTAEQFTDRIFLYPIQNAAKAYTGAYATRNKFEHPHSVSWQGLGTEFAALVRESRPNHLRVLVYNFAGEPLQGIMRVWRLDHGIYRVVIGPDADGDGVADARASEQQVELLRYSPVPVTLLPRQVTVIEVTQVQELDDIRQRPDLALSPLDTVVAGATVRGVVHNIGVAPVDETEVVLVSPAGQVVDRQRLSGIPGIGADLEAVRLAYELSGPPTGLSGYRVVVDPKDETAEIYEGNNEVTIP